MSEEPKVTDLTLNVDDRGYVHCVLDNMNSYGVKRTYIVENHSKGMLRAWHGHNDGFTLIHVISGAAKIGAINLEEASKYNLNGRPSYFMTTVSARKPQLVYIPAGWANGHMSLEDNTKLLVLSSLSFTEVKTDDKRLPSTLLRDIWDVKER